MRQIIKHNELTGEQEKVTLIKIIETDKTGKEYKREMNIRHALQSMRVQPDRYRLQKGEKLPKGISVDMVPAGTSLKDVREFEKKRGTVGKVTRTSLDNVLDALEHGIELQDVEVIDSDEGAELGSMMSDEAPKDYVPEGVDLTPAESMKEDLLDKTSKETPELNEIKEKELEFDEGAVATEKYTKSQLKKYPKDKLQAILAGLPAFKTMAEKMQGITMKANKDPMIDTIIQLSKKKAQKNKK
jgi:hypothetical protein